MCGRTSAAYKDRSGSPDWNEIATYLEVLPEDYQPSWNIKPTEKIPVAFTDKEGRPRFECAYWSLVPPWAKEMKSKWPTFNARAETAAEKPMFRSAVQTGRCILPVTAFYEWTGPKGFRTPHAIVGPDSILPLAGLYSWWKDPNIAGEEGWHLTTTILTRRSAGVMERIHDRMPVFMNPSLVEEWLDPALVGDNDLLQVVSEGALPVSEQLEQWEVRPLRGNGPELLDPVV